jgi:pyridoxamine 5'-phosphate oxidase
MNYKIANIRSDYTMKGLEEEDLHRNPLNQFEKWFEEVLSSGLEEPNAMLLSTVNNGKPSSRIVLLKDLDFGFKFFTNYDSKKGQQIAENPNVALTFFWKELERQVRIEGTAEKVTSKESDEYFASRPRGSQIGAWVSQQSAAIASREVLEITHADLERKFEGDDIPRPAHWGGYRVTPNYIEFWQGRPSRLHDRLAYTRLSQDDWKIERLSP